MITILLVDDQKEIVESLERYINWKACGIDKVYLASSAKEAKLLMVNFDIDILLTDIEMPEEDGLELFCWVKEVYPELLGIFLTSHADFEYARKALSLGGFDYILQPARYEEVERVLKKAVRKLGEEKQIHRYKKTGTLIEAQRDNILELMEVRAEQERDEEAAELGGRLKDILSLDFPDCVFHACGVCIRRFEHVSNQWDESLLKMVFRNVLEELLVEKGAKVCIAGKTKNQYKILTASEKGNISAEEWKKSMEMYAEFINTHMDFRIIVYPWQDEIADPDARLIREMSEQMEHNIRKDPGVIWQDEEINRRLYIDEERIRTAVQYIKNNLPNAISRAEVAEFLHLNEEYFTRLFKQYTGYTFKDFEMQERMNLAKNMLEHSNLPISMIAARAGYSNFSYFSKIFKKMTGYTPQEYKKNHKNTKGSHESSKEG